MCVCVSVCVCLCVCHNIARRYTPLFIARTFEYCHPLVPFAKDFKMNIDMAFKRWWKYIQKYKHTFIWNNAQDKLSARCGLIR